MFNPRYMYHAVYAARIITSQEERDSLGPGWAESPQAAEALVERPAEPKSQADLDAEYAARVLADEARVAAETREAEQVKAALEQQAANQLPIEESKPAESVPATVAEAVKVLTDVDAQVQAEIEALMAAAKNG